ncbi:trehalase family glycosidase [Leptothermofonsia sp. ETS-13]|uniref:trehalase family glycosidase n=1 Tax=Leptothermofonsia sp. ETS-13 TaxID=3035696 RepID=UPI003B9E3B35
MVCCVLSLCINLLGIFSQLTVDSVSLRAYVILRYSEARSISQHFSPATSSIIKTAFKEKDRSGALMLTLDNLKDETTSILSFIDQKWDQLTGNARSGHQDKLASWKAVAATSIDGHLDDTDPDKPYILFLPNDFIFPGGRFVVQFYWDSYFIILSLLRGNRFELAKGMVENCLFLVEQHGMVIANRKRWAAGSQLPFV